MNDSKKPISSTITISVSTQLTIPGGYFPSRALFYSKWTQRLYLYPTFLLIFYQNDLHYKLVSTQTKILTERFKNNFFSWLVG